MKRGKHYRFDFMRKRRSLPFFRGRPPWWPEDEPWPPIHRAMARNHKALFPRIVFGLLMAFVFTSIICSLAVHVLSWLVDGITKLDFRVDIVIFGVIGMAAVVFFFAGRALLRLVSPIDQILTASERIAGGDYTVRIPEHGGPEIRSLARAYNEMATRLQQHENQRRDLLANVTHELRTPLTIIQGRIEGMLDGVYPRHDANFESILEETRQMGRLIEDLRTLSLAESGALDLRKELTDLSVLIGETMAALRPQADEKGVICRVEIFDEIPFVNVDPLRLRTVVGNLIVNALRHTSEGDEIVAKCAMIEEDHLEISIGDTGEGIAPQDLPHVFDRFYKSAESTGSGLGLAIAKELVEAHDGIIQVESELGEGTIVRVRLPANAG